MTDKEKPDKPAKKKSKPKSRQKQQTRAAPRKRAAPAFRKDKRQGANSRYKRKADEIAEAPTRAPRAGGKSQGKGKLRTGNPGNKGNKMGRPRNVLRAAFREIVGMTQDAILERFEEINPKTRKRAIEELSFTQLRELMVDAAKYGIGAPQQHLKVKPDGKGGATIGIAVIGPMD